jgi:hypothetical protein
MAHHNIEPSLFKKGEYIGYDGRGYPWRIRKCASKRWQAVPGNAHPGRLTAPTQVAHSLAAVAALLAARGQTKTDAVAEACAAVGLPVIIVSV